MFRAVVSAKPVEVLPLLAVPLPARIAACPTTCKLASCSLLDRFPNGWGERVRARHAVLEAPREEVADRMRCSMLHFFVHQLVGHE
eukprot:4646260-Alexandrium_andersonii.AAC.1